MKRTPVIAVVAGEPSGDVAAAAVIRALKRNREASTFGIGGDALAGTGTLLTRHIRELTALGLVESVKMGFSWLRAMAQFREACFTTRPDLALLVDCPDVNLPLARALKADGIPVVQYVGPQVWAWRKSRLGLLKSRTSHVALILPFELPLYQAAGIPASYVGHPVLDNPAPATAASTRKTLHLPAHVPIVALLPGSRRAEVAALMPAMIEVGFRLQAKGLCPVLAPAKGAASQELLHQARNAGCLVWPDNQPVANLLAIARIGAVCSGTATLEAAVAQMPMIIVYRIDALSFALGKRVLQVPHVGLPNLIAGRLIVPELLQEQVTPDALCSELCALLEEPAQVAQKRALNKLVNSLEGPGAAQRTSDILQTFLPG